MTVHDLPPLRFADEGKLTRWAPKAARRASAVIVPSQFAKQEIVELLGVRPERVVVVPYGCEHEHFGLHVFPASQLALARLGLQGRFLLYVGGATTRKNVRAMLRAWKQVGAKWPDVMLGLVGPGEALEEIARDIGAPRVRVVGYLSRDVLPPVMKASSGLVFPSVYEGFGLPPLEALALGVPVAAVRAGAVPEVVGAHAILARSGEPESISEAIEQLLTDDAYRQRVAVDGPRHAQTFSWPAHATRIIDLYERVARGAPLHDG